MQKRIYGIETEYGIIFTPEGRKTLPVEKAIRFLFEKLITTEHFLLVPVSLCRHLWIRRIGTQWEVHQRRCPPDDRSGDILAGGLTGHILVQQQCR